MPATVASARLLAARAPAAHPAARSGPPPAPARPRQRTQARPSCSRAPGALVCRPGHAGVHREGCIEVGDCLGQAARRPVDLAAAGQRPGMPRVEFHGPAEIGPCCGGPARQPVGLAPAGQQPRRLGAGLQNAGEAGNGLVVATSIAQRPAAVGQRPRSAGIQLQGPAEIRDRLIVASQRAAGLAPAAPRPGVAGVEFHGPAEVGDRLGVAAQEPTGLAPAGVQDRRAGVRLDDPAVLTQRVLVLPGRPPGLGRGQGRLRRGGQPAAPLGDLTGQRHPALSLVQGGGQRRGLLHQLPAGREVPLPQADVERRAGRVVQVGLAAGSPGRRHRRVRGLAGCVVVAAGGPGPGGQPPGAGSRRVASPIRELDGGGPACPGGPRETGRRPARSGPAS